MSLNTERSQWRTDGRFRAAVLLATLFHGGLLASGSHKRTYDAYVHLFFADHYARDWFSSWEPRWYTGFPVVSYPPGVHQLLAILKAPLGADGAYVAVQLGALLFLVLGVYRFANLWVGPRAAGWAVLAAVLSSSLAEVVHVFGQLPTTLALAFLLNAQPSIARWLTLGHRRDLLLGLAFLASTTAVHHVTTLFGSVFFTGPVIARVVLDAFAQPSPDEPLGRVQAIRPDTLVPIVARRLRRMLPALRRVAVLGITIVFTLAVVILPYWLWSSRDPIVQVPIPHGSRDNFLANTDAGLVFWLVPWASVLLLVPAALGRNLFTKLWPLTASTALLFVLGTGGTTPIPRLLLGGAFEILTLDRFTIWATIMVLPLAALVVESLVDPHAESMLRSAFGRRAGTVVLGACVLVAVVSSLFAASLASLRPMQPENVDPDPITSFIAKDDHDNWRYLLLGFGDQMAAISAETTALTVDGNYHSARRLPELTSRSVERLEGAKFRGVPGLGSLQQFLANPERYNLKFVFSNDAFYEPLLWSLGWNRLGALDNNVIVWERADVAPLPTAGPRPEIPLWQRLMWGILPPAAIVSAGIATIVLVVTTPPSKPTRRGRNGRVDRLLAAQASKLHAVKRHDARTVLLAMPWSKLITPNRVRVVAAMAAVSLVGAAGWITVTRSAGTPSDVVVAYYEALDVQDLEGAWELLDPTRRLPLGEHLEQRSLLDGLLDGYAELDSVRVRSTDVSGTSALLSVELEYLTALETIEVLRTHELQSVDGNWVIVPPISPLPRQPGTVRTDTDVDLLAADSRAPLGQAVTVPRRPLVVVAAAPLVIADGTWTALGEVTNVDQWPAQVTVTATMRDGSGDVVATASATTHTVHSVLPGETVPYRIDFTSDTTGDFDPAAGGGLLAGDDSLEAVRSVEISARAVITVDRTERDLAIVDLAGTQDTIEAGLVNTSTSAVTIPKIVMSFYGPDGSLRWVDTAFVQSSAPAMARHELDLDIEIPAVIETLDVPVTVLGSDGFDASARLDRFALDRATGAASVAFNLAGFERASAQ